MKYTLFSILFFSLFLASRQISAQVIEKKYDFNHLVTDQNLNGQDNWKTVKNQYDSPNPLFDDWHPVIINKGGIVAPDNSKFIAYDGENTNVGKTASRLSTDALPFDFSIGGAIEIQFDMRRAYWKTYFGFAYDKNNNGITLKGLENVMQFEANEGGIGIHLSQGNPQFNIFIKPDGTYLNLGVNNDSLKNHWFSWKIVLDLDAFNKQGSVSVSYKQDNQNKWLPCPLITNLNLGLTPGSGDRKDPKTWTKLLIHSTGFGCVDNIYVRQPQTGGKQYQYLSFDAIPDHLTTDNPFTVRAQSNKGLPVSYSIASGPATVSGNMVTLTGQPGKVFVVASQPGNDTIAPAANDTTFFNVIDPYIIIPTIEIRNPVNLSNVNSPELDYILLTSKTAIEFDNLLNIKEVYYTINSEKIQAFPSDNGYYTGYWKPTSFGKFTVTATVVSEFNISGTHTINFEVVNDPGTKEFIVLDKVHGASIKGTMDFPSFSGIYKKITAKLYYDCPPEGCEPWDTGTEMTIVGSNGSPLNIFTYITPYGVACQDSIDITDFASQLQGKVDVIINFTTRSLATLKIIYYEGIPEYKYSWVDHLWEASYLFGAITNPQPVPEKSVNFSDNAFKTPIKAAILRNMSHGHGWGSTNTGNAAEFKDATHSFKIDGEKKFTQHLWQDCNPNPVSCQPQNGTWYYDRAGWCPGSIPMLWRFDLKDEIGKSFNLKYEFDPTYQDLCSPYNPNCVSGVTCADCNDVLNPVIWVHGQIIKFFDAPPIPTTSIYENELHVEAFSVFPNPSNGSFKISSTKNNDTDFKVQIFSISGKIVEQFRWDGKERIVNLNEENKGIFIIKVTDDKNIAIKKIIIE